MEKFLQESPFEQCRREKFIAEGITQGEKEAILKNLLTVLNAKFPCRDGARLRTGT